MSIRQGIFTSIVKKMCMMMVFDELDWNQERGVINVMVNFC